jgi:Ssp1 endopeptidase immunity protein Rap1a
MRQIMSISIRLTLPVALLISSFIAGAASEEPMYLAWIRVNDLVKKCSADKTWETAYCIGYVVGVADVANNDPTPLKICIPKSVTQAQMKSIVVQYFTQHPSESDYAAFSSVRIALRERFPCAAPGSQ